MEAMIQSLMANPAIAMAVIMNNYFHDVATATLLSSGVIFWILGRRAQAGDKAERQAFWRAYAPLTMFARGALAWIIVGGVFRTIFFKYAEFIPSAQKNILPDLMIKHIVLVSAVIAGAVMWRNLGKIAKAELESVDTP